MRGTTWKNRPWGSKSELKRLSGSLAIAEREDFQAQALPFLRAIWPEAIAAPASRSFDRAGVDHLVWEDGGRLPLVVQCKGFHAGTQALGPTQIRSCRHSIRSFAASGLRTDHYVLVHNRDARDEAFRKAVEAELEKLQHRGVAARAELWDRQSLLRAAFDAMYERLRASIQSRSPSLLPARADTQVRFAPLEDVPLRESLLVVDQHHLRADRPTDASHGDPAHILSKQTASNLTLLLGGFGMGKTTAVQRTMQGVDRVVLYVPGARLSDEVSGAKQFLTLCLDQEDVLSPFPPEDWPVLEQLLRPAIEYLLKDESMGVLLILDGLDESAFLTRAGGLQALFNILEPIRIPVVLTMRTEFWLRRRGEFEHPFGMEARHGERRHRRVAVVELLPWADEHILTIVERAREGATEEQGDRLRALEDLIRSASFDRLYGDIPRRPLFLRQIVESVAEHGLPGDRVTRVTLMTEWIQAKIRRDVLAPRQVGGLGRTPLMEREETTESVVETCWEAMIAAAAAMTSAQEEGLVLLGDCAIERVYELLPHLRREPLGLILHSLLLPVPEQRPQRPLHVQFAHRSFQEFFLALHLVRQPAGLAGLAIPETLSEWIREIADPR